MPFCKQPECKYMEHVVDHQWGLSNDQAVTDRGVAAFKMLVQDHKCLDAIVRLGQHPSAWKGGKDERVAAMRMAADQGHPVGIFQESIRSGDVAKITASIEVLKAFPDDPEAVYFQAAGYKTIAFHQALPLLGKALQLGNPHAAREMKNLLNSAQDNTAEDVAQVNEHAGTLDMIEMVTGGSAAFSARLAKESGLDGLQLSKSVGGREVVRALKRMKVNFDDVTPVD
jgi:hypothetical protein